MQLLRDNLTTSTSDQEPAKTDQPAGRGVASCDRRGRDWRTEHRRDRSEGVSSS